MDNNYALSEVHISLIFNTESRGDMYIRNVGNTTDIYMVQSLEKRHIKNDKMWSL
jgi:hypothetical protein